MLSWGGETVGHTGMEAEEKAPKGTDPFGLLNFPQSVLGVDKSPDKSRNQLSQENAMRSFQ